MKTSNEHTLVVRSDLGPNTYTLIAAGDDVPDTLAGYDTVPATKVIGDSGKAAPVDPPAEKMRGRPTIR
jgi:hypothetical protein